MESKEEAIRLLKKRMHQQMNISPEKEINPENIQYYVSSLMMQREEMYQEESMRQEEDEEQDLHDGADVEEVSEENGEYEEPETKETQHERAKNEYEKTMHAVDEEEMFGFRKLHWLNIKG